jgi:predicted kinase
MNRLHLPASCLIVLAGPPGAGKSTWARRNGRGAIHVSQDDLIDAITPHGFEQEYRPIYAAAEEAIARAALDAGHTVIVDRTNRTTAHRLRWIALAKTAGCIVAAVEVNTPLDLCRERNRARRDHRQVSETRLERIFAAMEPVRLEEGFAAVYDGDAVTLEEILTDLKLRQEIVSYEHCH